MSAALTPTQVHNELLRRAERAPAPRPWACLACDCDAYCALWFNDYCENCATRISRTKKGRHYHVRRWDLARSDSLHWCSSCGALTDQALTIDGVEGELLRFVAQPPRQLNDWMALTRVAIALLDEDLFSDLAFRRDSDASLESRRQTALRWLAAMVGADLASTEGGEPKAVAVLGNVVLCRGMVLRRTRQESEEVGIVLGPAEKANYLGPIDGAFEVVHGWIDHPPACGLFTVRPKDIPNVWRRATPEEAAHVRALFLAHAKTWGPDSNAWVAKTIPSDEQHRWIKCATNASPGCEVCAQCGGERWFTIGGYLYPNLASKSYTDEEPTCADARHVRDSQMV